MPSESLLFMVFLIFTGAAVFATAGVVCAPGADRVLYRARCGDGSVAARLGDGRLAHQRRGRYRHHVPAVPPRSQHAPAETIAAAGLGNDYHRRELAGFRCSRRSGRLSAGLYRRRVARGRRRAHVLEHHRGPEAVANHGAASSAHRRDHDQHPVVTGRDCHRAVAGSSGRHWTVRTCSRTWAGWRSRCSEFAGWPIWWSVMCCCR